MNKNITEILKRTLCIFLTAGMILSASGSIISNISAGLYDDQGAYTEEETAAVSYEINDEEKTAAASDGELAEGQVSAKNILDEEETAADHALDDELDAADSTSDKSSAKNTSDEEETAAGIYNEEHDGADSAAQSINGKDAAQGGNGVNTSSAADGVSEASVSSAEAYGNTDAGETSQLKDSSSEEPVYQEVTVRLSAADLYDTDNVQSGTVPTERLASACTFLEWLSGNKYEPAEDKQNTGAYTDIDIKIIGFLPWGGGSRGDLNKVCRT